jgi:hypothetical protein
VSSVRAVSISPHLKYRRRRRRVESGWEQIWEPNAAKQPKPPEMRRHGPDPRTPPTCTNKTRDTAQDRDRLAHNPEVAGSNPVPATSRNARWEQFGNISIAPLTIFFAARNSHPLQIRPDRNPWPPSPCRPVNRLRDPAARPGETASRPPCEPCRIGSASSRFCRCTTTKN